MDNIWPEFICNNTLIRWMSAARMQTNVEELKIISIKVTKK